METDNTPPASQKDEDERKSIVDQFFDEARLINLGEKNYFDVSPLAFSHAANSLAFRSEFRRKFQSFSQDPEARRLVIDFLRQLAHDQEMIADRYANSVDTIDKYGGRISLAGAVGGIGALAYGAVAAGTIPVIGPAALVIMGFAGMGISLIKRSEANLRRHDATRSKACIDMLLVDLQAVVSEAKGGNHV